MCESHKRNQWNEMALNIEGDGQQMELRISICNIPWSEKFGSNNVWQTGMGEKFGKSIEEPKGY